MRSSRLVTLACAFSAALGPRAGAAAAPRCVEPALPPGAVDVVIGGHQRGESHDWLDAMGLTNARVLRYIRENPEEPLPPPAAGPCNSTIEAVGLFPNHGRDAAAFYDYVSRNYDALPELVVFVHGHGHRSWHATCRALVGRARRAYGRLAADPADDLVRSHTFTLTEYPNEPNASYIGISDGYYKTFAHMPAYASCLALLANLSLSLDAETSQSCCASLISPRAAIRRQPRATYEALARYIAAEPDDYGAGVVCFEQLVWKLVAEPPPTDETLAFYRESEHFENAC